MTIRMSKAGFESLTSRKIKQIDVKAEAKKIRRSMEASEHEIQASIMQFLQFRGWFVWRNNSGFIPMGEGDQKRAIRMGIPGLPDLFALKRGVFMGVEVKRPGKKPTMIQEQMLKELKSHGAQTIVAHSVEEIEKFIRDLFLLT